MSDIDGWVLDLLAHTSISTLRFRHLLRISASLVLFITQAGWAQQDRYFGLHMDFHANVKDSILPLTTSLETQRIRFSSFLKAVRPDYLQVDCKGHAGYTSWPSKWGTQAGSIGHDPLALWSDICKELNTPLWVHYSGVQDGAALLKHPHWAALTADGKPHDKATSMTSAYVDSLMLPQLLEVHQRYGVAGAWVDGDCWGQELDHHPQQQQAFLRQYPQFSQTPKKGQPGYDQWVAMQRQQFMTYLQHLKAELGRRAPGMRLISNWAFSSHIPLPALPQYQELSGDLSPTNALNAAHFEGRFLRGQSSRWDIMLWGHARNFNTGFRTLKTTQQVLQEAAHILALGGGVSAFFNMQRDGGPSHMVTPMARNLARFMNQWRGQTAYHHPGWKSAAEIAVVIPSAYYMQKMAANGSLYRAWNGEYNDLEGLSMALQAAGLSYDFVLESQASERLPAYAYALLPDCDTLTPAAVQALESFAGPVLISGPRAAHLLPKRTGLPRLTIEAVKAGMLAQFQDTTTIGINTELGRLPATYPGQVSHLFGTGYTELHKAKRPGTYHMGNTTMTLFPLGREYKLNTQSSLAKLLSQSLTANKPATLQVVKGNLSVVPYKQDKKNVIFLANNAGDHHHPNVYQMATIPASGPFYVYLGKQKPTKFQHYPGSAQVRLAKGVNGWYVTGTEVLHLLRLSWE